ncbi:fimbrial biogenesis chaperone [Klebsiella pneumoniae]|uniref:fimbrial biogenesis chaperone n=1 Tax=Klebsiella pneumoniae TaxID=573 RepID=UPI000A4AA890|nr:molecular chaperone [Klebsiella pneumoniae]
MYLSDIKASLLIMLTLVSYVPTSYASVTMLGTRIIYKEDKRSEDIRFFSSDNVPSIISLWINKNPYSSQGDNSPFVVTPAVFKIDPGKGQSARLMFTGASMPKDRESLFYFNFVQLPASDKNANKLLVSYKSTVKLIYRPAALNYDIDKVRNYLKADISNAVQGQITIKNDSPFYVTLTRFTIFNNDKVLANNSEKNLNMLSPFSSNVYKIKPQRVPAGTVIQVKLINDLGGLSTYKISDYDKNN